MAHVGVQATTDRKIGGIRFKNGEHLDWLEEDTKLALLWMESGAGKNAGYTDAVIDLINACDHREVTLWIGFAHKWPYGERHAHCHPRIDEWMDDARRIVVGTPPDAVKLPTKAKK